MCARAVHPAEGIDGLSAAVARLARDFLQADIPSPALDARLLAAAACGLSHEDLLREPGRPLDPAERNRIAEWRERRLAREPVSRILGMRAFWRHEFLVTPATLDPRPDSETVVETALAVIKREGWLEPFHPNRSHSDDAILRQDQAKPRSAYPGVRARGFAPKMAQDRPSRRVSDWRAPDVETRLPDAKHRAAPISTTDRARQSRNRIDSDLDERAPNRPLRILDLGTGTGCLLLSVLAEIDRASGLGVDNNPDAVSCAADNARRLGIADRAAFACTDWCSGLTGRFDLIVSNPPYIAESSIDGLAREVADHDPRSALNGGRDGLDAYRAMVPAAARLLAPGGWLIVEIGVGQADAVIALMRGAGLSVAPGRLLTVRDLTERVRVVGACAFYAIGE